MYPCMLKAFQPVLNFKIKNKVLTSINIEKKSDKKNYLINKNIFGLLLELTWKQKYFA